MDSPFPIIDLIARILVFLLGAALVISVLNSAIRTFVLPRSAHDWLLMVVFKSSGMVFSLFTRRAKTYEERDQMMALYAPVTLIVLPAVWLLLVLIGYMAMFVTLGSKSLESAFTVSGSSLLTLGFERQEGIIPLVLSFSEAAIGLILVALLIAYLPTIYSAFSHRETAVTMLEVRAGSPPSAVELFVRFHNLKRLDKLTQLWEQWETLFAELEESHTSLAMLAFFRSPQSHRSWVTAAGAVLDAASLAESTVDIPPNPQAALTIRAGYIALQRIAAYFGVPYNANPTPTDPISVSRLEFDIACNYLAEKGVPLKADRDQAWRDYAGWRVNYDIPLLALCGITMAPYAPWSSDRSLRKQRMLAKRLASRRGGTLPIEAIQESLSPGPQL
ncbi:MAG: hypothetical protein ABI947_17685 [Chloroflexota bacterium]